jgi:hypothetical protein
VFSFLVHADLVVIADETVPIVEKIGKSVDSAGMIAVFGVNERTQRRS